MDFTYFKLVLLFNGWLFANGSPVAMLQHATSSQSIVFHTGLPDSSTSFPNSPTQELYNSGGVTRSPKYEYKYEVNDQQTGDRKSHWESREGDRVRGVYTLYEPDGAQRTVEYSADALHGFNAVVKRNEPNKHQYSGHSSPVGHTSGSSHHFDSLSTEQESRNIFSSESRGRDSSVYASSKNNFNSGVDFSINHALKKIGGSGNNY